ncbi:MAG: substrate-binding domain-containing protein [Clostridiales bacterium]
MSSFIKKSNLILIIISFFLLVFLSSFIIIKNKASSPLIESKYSNEEYYMITFLSGIEYWKNCYSGFENASKAFGVKTIYTGSPEYDVNQEITILDQIIAKNPSGIAISCINPDAFETSIKKAINSGIPVVTFDADSPNSGRYSFLATNNRYAGEKGAKVLSELLGENGGNIVILTLPIQLNHEERTKGFVNAVKNKYTNLKVVKISNGRHDQTEAAKELSGILQSNNNIKGVFCTDSTSGVGAATAVRELNKIEKIKIVSFDTDNGTLDYIKSNVISATIAQGTYSMGYKSMNFLFKLNHDYIKKGIEPDDSVIPPFVDTGVDIVTKENVDNYYKYDLGIPKK